MQDYYTEKDKKEQRKKRRLAREGGEISDSEVTSATEDKRNIVKSNENIKNNSENSEITSESKKDI